MKDEITTILEGDGFSTAIFGVQLSNVIIHKSTFEKIFTLVEDVEDEHAMNLGIRAFIRPDNIFAHLNVKVINLFPSEEETKLEGFNCDFCVLGDFHHKDISRANLETFVNTVVLSTLLPFAREYHSDISNRIGFPNAFIPLINPQLVAQNMIKRDAIEIDFKEYDKYQLENTQVL